MKTLLDFTYFSFKLNSANEIISRCRSTIGYLEQCSRTLNTFFVARSNIDSHFEIDRLRVILKKSPGLFKFSVPFRFHRQLKALNPDFILVHGFGYAHYLIFLRLILPNSRILLQCNGYAPAPKGIKKLVYRVADRSIDGYLFTGTENARPWYEAGVFSKHKVFEVMEGGTAFQKTQNHRPENSFLWVGRLNQGKDPMTVLHAFAKFVEIEPSARLTMVFSEGLLRQEAAAFVLENGLSSMITLAGYVEHEKLEQVYNSHRFFISASRFEGSGYALSEAMACGCVPIVTSIPPFNFMTKNGEVAYLFSAGSVGELTLQLVNASKCDWKEMSAKITAHHSENLSFSAIADRINFIFGSLEQSSPKQN